MLCFIFLIWMGFFFYCIGLLFVLRKLDGWEVGHDMEALGGKYDQKYLIFLNNKTFKKVEKYFL